MLGMSDIKCKQEEALTLALAHDHFLLPAIFVYKHIEVVAQ